MKSYPVSIRWTHSFGFRAGEWASVIGVKIVDLDGLEPRLCYSVMYEDGFCDGVPVSDSDNYEVKADKVALTFFKPLPKGNDDSGFYADNGFYTETYVDGHRYIENDDGRNDLDPDCIAEEYRRQMDKDD